MNCPACSRPIAMARATCMYCGAALSDEVREQAALAARRVLQTKSLVHLEAAARGLDGEANPRRYVVVDTSASSIESLMSACSVSAWEAGQWQAASRYRLFKVTTEPEGGPLESLLKEKAAQFFVLTEDTVSRSRNPIALSGCPRRAYTIPSE